MRHEVAYDGFYITSVSKSHNNVWDENTWQILTEFVLMFGVSFPLRAAPLAATATASLVSSMLAVLLPKQFLDDVCHETLKAGVWISLSKSDTAAVIQIWKKWLDFLLQYIT